MLTSTTGRESRNTKAPSHTHAVLLLITIRADRAAILSACDASYPVRTHMHSYKSWNSKPYYAIPVPAIFDIQSNRIVSSTYTYQSSINKCPCAEHSVLVLYSGHPTYKRTSTYSLTAEQRPQKQARALPS